MIVLVYGQLGNDSQSIQSRNGVLFFITITCNLFQIQFVILVFPDEKPVFYKEYGNRMYSSFMYFCAVVTVGLPNVFIYSTLSTLIYYFVIELNTTSADRYYIHYSYHLLLCNASTALGYMVGISFSDKALAVGMLPVVVLPFMLVGGYLVNQNNFVLVMKPFEYTSLYKYAYQVFIINEYEDLDLDCAPECYPVKQLDFEETMDESIIATACLCVGLYVIAYKNNLMYLMLLFFSRKSR
jgi:ATP-binding cassette, subfamily G (WHITE), eye pigment precursor transporter